MKQTRELLSAIQGVSNKLRILKENEIKNIELDDFSFSYFKYLEAIHKLGNPTFIELAQFMELSKPTVTITVNKLIEKGYIIKTKSLEDGRVFYLSLTEQSNKIITSHMKVFEKFIKDIAERFSEDELDTLIFLLNRI